MTRRERSPNPAFRITLYPDTVSAVNQRPQFAQFREARMFVDTLKEVDEGGYHFFYQITQQVPAVVPVMRMGDWLSTYLAACVMLLVVLALFLREKRNAAVFVSLAVFLLGVFFVEA